ncbi:hypothetical protein UFOVP641_3 [uncultured Caudovirales phage]|uniref:Uncharacterized protein n=1 Tax=uncultured Caudovirales phage TaxID=2100421 RepID=A0A6J5N434_9CAUD|nr:hypothetical protein UFOVP641_3 [uncultured Caudovirales phage]
MTTNETLATEQATDAQETSQEQVGKTYTQEEFDRHMAGLKNSIAKKYEKQFAELGDLDELKQLKAQSEKQRQEESLKRGEFEKILQDLASKKDQEIARRDSMISEFKIEMPLIQAASQFKSVNPEQVKSLLRNNVRLSNGDVEVVDEAGQVRYSDAGKPFTPQELVKEFLDKNPHFVQATPSTSNGKSSVNPGKSTKLDVTTLDMTKPEHRALYKEYKKANGIN